MRITRINHAAVNVTGKVQEAREFYVDLLGLPEVPIQLPGMAPVAKSDLGFWVEHGGLQVHVIGREPLGGTPDPTQAHLSWYVEDLDAATQELEARGMGMRVMGEGLNRIIWVLDPAGNIVEFQQDPECVADPG
jgi:catechol 2,3-dioxygenase-like lactoylglutathione lyase family enzyme